MAVWTRTRMSYSVRMLFSRALALVDVVIDAGDDDVTFLGFNNNAVSMMNRWSRNKSDKIFKASIKTSYSVLQYDENEFQILSVEDMTFKTSPPFLHRIIRILFERNDQNFVTNVRSTCWFWCLVLRIFDYLVSGWDNKKRLKRDLRVFPRISMRRTDLGLFTIRVSHASIREKI